MNMFASLCSKKVAINLVAKWVIQFNRANSYHCYEKDFQLLENYVYKLNLQS